MSLEIAMRAYLRERGVMAALDRIDDFVGMELLTAQAAGNVRDYDFWKEVRGELIRAEGNLRSLMKGEVR